MLLSWVWFISNWEKGITGSACGNATWAHNSKLILYHYDLLGSFSDTNICYSDIRHAKFILWYMIYWEIELIYDIYVIIIILRKYPRDMDISDTSSSSRLLSFCHSYYWFFFFFYFSVKTPVCAHWISSQQHYICMKDFYYYCYYYIFEYNIFEQNEEENET